jgi:hypothetical protein
MEKEWVKIFEAPEELQIEIAHQILQENKIDSVIINKKDRVYKIGDLELYVHRDNALRAKQFLKDL